MIIHQNIKHNKNRKSFERFVWFFESIYNTYMNKLSGSLCMTKLKSVDGKNDI